MAYKILNRHLRKVINEIDTHNRHIRYKLSRKFDNMYDKELWGISLYYSLISLVKNIITLLGSDNIVSVLIITRSCLDAYNNLENVFNNYDKYMQYEKYKFENEYKEYYNRH